MGYHDLCACQATQFMPKGEAMKGGRMVRRLPEALLADTSNLNANMGGRARRTACSSASGSQTRITVVERKDLEDALVHPEMHHNLIVRVGGFSARFVESSREVQTDILNRTRY